jgi:two-component system alkaline phosphatase synthesis response regulator PhoP
MQPGEIFITAEDLKRARERYIAEYRSLIPPLVVDDRNHRVFRGRQEISGLTSRELDLLILLKRGHGKIRSRDDVYLAVWKTDKGVSDEAIDSFISRLRAKIEWDPRNPVYLVTERGRGYRLINTR